ncbi:hypothetical protein PBRA_002774 [Plasmodiophora brassicae]|uniref:Uncharacterized protein n=1 Tax=Plasmodiophora brassicae TaxID=37360 RepID=A0A0G4J5L6_PLABS|nr:hypothetical protein PBRA_002774 [Plasmodiophora brassicae]
MAILVSPRLKCSARMRQAMMGLSNRVESVHRADMWYRERLSVIAAAILRIRARMRVVIQDATAYASSPEWYAAGNSRLYRLHLQGASVCRTRRQQPLCAAPALAAEHLSGRVGAGASGPDDRPRRRRVLRGCPRAS